MNGLERERGELRIILIKCINDPACHEGGKGFLRDVMALKLAA